MKDRLTSMLVIGGCRSGKSTYALNHCNNTCKRNKFFLATCQPSDAEMEQRAVSHQRERGPDWNTIEEPVFLFETIQQLSSTADIILVDCLTLWVSNLMARNDDPDRIINAVRQLADSLEDLDCAIVFVSNEVGSGIVPENRLARLFRDTAGMVNQVMAARVDQFVYMVAGHPLQMKPSKK